MAITPLPPAPEPTDSTAQFNAKAFSWVASLDDFTTETNALANNVNGLQVQAQNSATAAASSATASAISAANSLASEQIATAATGAPIWVSGTTYSLGATVFSPINGRIYRRVVAGGGTTDPASDSTNWREIYGNDPIAITGQLSYLTDFTGLLSRDLQPFRGTDIRELLAQQIINTYDIAGIAARDVTTRAKIVAVPANATAAGTKGEFSYDDDFIYVCIQNNTWKRVGISTW
jgi:hypothetical protein